jgi:hypothetical protein
VDFSEDIVIYVQFNSKNFNYDYSKPKQLENLKYRISDFNGSHAFVLWKRNKKWYKIETHHDDSTISSHSNSNFKEVSNGFQLVNFLNTVASGQLAEASFDILNDAGLNHIKPKLSLISTLESSLNTSVAEASHMNSNKVYVNGSYTLSYIKLPQYYALS